MGGPAGGGEISAVISLSVPSEGTSAGGVSWLGGSGGEASVSTGCVITDSAGSGLARVSSEVARFPTILAARVQEQRKNRARPNKTTVMVVAYS